MAAVALITSLSCKTIGCSSSSIVVLADTLLVLNKLNTFEDASVYVNVIVSAFPESSDTNIDFTIRNGERVKLAESFFKRDRISAF